MSNTVVLLHGFTNTSRSWDPVIAALPDGYQPVALDIRGHGLASETRPMTLDAVIEDISAAASEPFTLVGYSMGGRIALHAAFRLPERILRLVLIGASPGLEDAAARAERRAADDKLATQIERQTIAEFVDSWARTLVLADQPEQVRTRGDVDRVGLAAALRVLGTGSLGSLWRRLPRLQMPVELVVGERDAKFRRVAEQMAESIPDTRISVVPRTGHAVHLEEPGRVAELIAGDRTASH
jgi:2-succinyl-6-hydroxy-2,4-cyclohexadiene-1-carboxylate synthase